MKGRSGMLAAAATLAFFLATPPPAHPASPGAPRGGAVPKGHAKAGKRAEAGRKKERYRQGELLVKFRQGVPDGRRTALHGRHGSSLERDYPPTRLHRVRLRPGLSVESAARLYGADPDVEYAEPDFVLRARVLPDDPALRPGTADAYNLLAVGAPAAWELSTGRRDVVVAVIDTGIDYLHPDLAANVWTDPADGTHGYNAITRSRDPRDDNGHGTHVAGTIGAVGNNGIGTAGVNWSVSVMACKFLDKDGYGYTSDAIDCLQFVRFRKYADGVNVVATNNSWGGDEFSQALRDELWAQRDILFVASAGNDGSNNDEVPSYPASYDFPSVVAVAATDERDGPFAAFSNRGRRTVHVAAPGDRVYSAMPDNNTWGVAGGYGYLSGTSMAAPHVTGLAALLAAREPGLGWIGLRNRILSGGDPKGALAEATVTGRRVSLPGSLSCTDRPLFSVLRFPAAPVPGAAETVTVLSINCAAPAGPVAASADDGSAIDLRDDGGYPDLAAGDGIFSGRWTPATAGPVLLRFSSPAGSETVATPPLDLKVLPPAGLRPGESGSRFSLAPAGVPYRQSFPATGGIAPLRWSVASGSLPPGLSLDAATGEISGTPTAGGFYPFRVEAADAVPSRDGADWTVVVNGDVRPGWPIVLPGTLPDYHEPYPPVPADLDGDGRKEIVVVDEVSGDWFNPESVVRVLDGAGGIRAERSFAGMATQSAVADIDRDGTPEIVLTLGARSSDPDPVYALRPDLSTHPGFPGGGYPSFNGGTGFAASPGVADLDGDGRPSILAYSSPNNGNDPNYEKAILVHVDASGADVPGWPRTIGRHQRLLDALPAVADVDGDGRREVVHPSMDGFVRFLRKDGTEAGGFRLPGELDSAATPLLADFDGDGLPEVVLRYSEVADPGRSVVAICRRDGTPLPGWPRRFEGSSWHGGQPALADLDGRGELELLLVTGEYRGSTLVALRADGTALPGWPVRFSDDPYESAYPGSHPLAGDVDGDGRQEVVVATTGFSMVGQELVPVGKVHAYARDGAELPGFPKYATPWAEAWSSPALADLDGDGRTSIVLRSDEGRVHAWTLPRGAVAPEHDWPMPFHDLWRSGYVVARPPSDPPPVPIELQTGGGGGGCHVAGAGEAFATGALPAWAALLAALIVRRRRG